MIVVATTLCAFAMGDPATWGSWLRNAEAMRDSHPDGDEVRFFCAIEVDGRGLEPFGPLLSHIEAFGLPVFWWTFSLDDGRTEVTTANRSRHIVMGQNVCVEYAMTSWADWLLFLAADLAPPPDAIPRLLEVGWPLVGGHVPTYCLDGPSVEGYDFPVKRHMPTAAFVLLRRDLFRILRWRWDVDLEMTDDPCLYWDAKRLLGVEAYVRHDCVGEHYPRHVPAIERRGHDLRVVR